MFGFSTSLPVLGVSLYFMSALVIGVECTFNPGFLKLSTNDNLDWIIL